MFDEELESFKRIDLRVYAASQAFQLDKRESWRGSAVMRHPNNDKIVIKRDTDGHFVYFSVRDETDNGSIIDFIQRRESGISIGVVRKILRPWIGQPPVPVPSFAPLHETSKDRLRVETEFARMAIARSHPYLERERALPCSILGSPRFIGRIRLEHRTGLVFPNAVFPHFDKQGLCGYEIKNSGFTGFARGGWKGLWFSRSCADDKRIVLSESAIDALSYAALFPIERTRYASIGGKPNPQQPELVRATILRMPHGSMIVAAMDADAEGNDLNDVIRQAVASSGRADLRFVVERPLFKDWNDQLRNVRTPATHGATLVTVQPK